MPRTLESYLIQVEGGGNFTANVANILPGEAREILNYEPSLHGGYRSLNGFQEYISGATVSGSGNILGTQVYTSGVVACRDDGVWFANPSDSAWTKINTVNRTAADYYRFDQQAQGGLHLLGMVDGINLAAIWDGSTYTTVSGGAPVDPSHVAFHKDTLFLAGYSANNAAVSFSQPSSAAGFDASLGAGEINVGDEVTGLKSINDQLIIFGRRSIHRLLGDNSSNFELQPITRDLGCTLPDTIQEIGGDLLFFGPDGINTLSDLSQLGNLELETITEKVQADILSLRTRDRLLSVAVRSKNQYRLFSHSAASNETVAGGYVGGLRRDAQQTLGWEWMPLRGIKPYSAHSGYIGNEEYVMHGGYDGKVYRQEKGNTFGGTNFITRYATPYMHMDQPDIRKVIHRIISYIRLEGNQNINVQLSFNYGSRIDTVQPAVMAIGNVNLDTPAKYGTAVYSGVKYGVFATPAVRQNAVGSGFNVSVIYTTNDSNSPHSIQAVGLEFAYGGRR